MTSEERREKERARDAEFTHFHVGAYATLGAILGGEKGFLETADLANSVEYQTTGGVAVGAAAGGRLGLSRFFDVTARLGLMHQITGGVRLIPCFGVGCPPYESGSADASRTHGFLEATVRVRPAPPSHFYLGAGGRVGIIWSSVTYQTPASPGATPVESKRDPVLAAGIVEAGTVFGPVDVGLRGGVTTLSKSDFGGTVEVTVGWEFL